MAARLFGGRTPHSTADLWVDVSVTDSPREFVANATFA
jgi:hypothetical protein